MKEKKIRDHQSLAARLAKNAPATMTYQTPDAKNTTSYERLFLPQERLILLGGGHISVALCDLASQLGFAVTVVDDRPTFVARKRFSSAHHLICNSFVQAIQDLHITQHDYVCVLTRGHRFDHDCLDALFQLKVRPHYLGMIGSKRRVRELFQLLQQEGHSPEDTSRVRAPIGLTIHAANPAEIAVSILAELIYYRRKEDKASPKNKHRLERTDADPVLMDFFQRADRAYSMAVILETKGSTPADTGALMAVDQEGNIYGSIGGGCGEDTVRRVALKTLDDGQAKLVDVDMTNEVAEDEGMVCGGTMKVLVERVTP